MTRVSRKILLVLTLVVLAPVVAGAGWLGWRWINTASDEAACDCGDDPIDAERFAYLNPFRNKVPEQMADELMRRLQSGECESIPAMQSYCERERRLKVASWKITGLDGGEVGLYVTRTDPDCGNAFSDPVWIDVKKHGALWKVDHVGLYY
jgi:hypothetical protein